MFGFHQCNGWTEWCIREIKDGVQYLGCEDYVDQCTDRIVWDEKKNWIQWVMNLIHTNISSNVPKLGGSKPGHQFSSMEEQEYWLKIRDSTTTRTQLRNNLHQVHCQLLQRMGLKLLICQKN